MIMMWWRWWLCRCASGGDVGVLMGLIISGGGRLVAVSR